MLTLITLIIIRYGAMHFGLYGRKDNYPKAVGLAKFAEKHWDKFGRIQLIRLKKGVDGRDHFYRLDMKKTTVRNKVRGITSNEELDRIFDTDAVRED